MIMHWRYKGIWALVPLLVLLANFVINLIVASLIKTEFTSGSVASLPMALMVSAIIAPIQTFPFAVGLGLRRREYFLGTAAAAVAISACFALLLTVLAAIESRLTGHWGGTLHFFVIPAFKHLSPIGLFWLHFAVSACLAFAGLFIFAVWARFGRKGMTALFVGGPAVLAVLAFVADRNNWWALFGTLLEPQTISILGYWLLPIAAVQALLVFGLLRRATV